MSRARIVAPIAFLLTTAAAATAQVTPPPGDPPPPPPAPTATAPAPTATAPAPPPPAPAEPPPVAPPPAAPPPPAPAGYPTAAPGAAPYPPPPGYPGYAGPQPGYGGCNDPSLPLEMDYRSDRPIPPCYRLEEEMNTGLVLAGVSLLGGLYLGTVFIGAGMYDSASEDERDGYVPMFVPVAGPFILLGTTDATAMGSFFAVASGLTQATGLALLIAGLAVSDEVLVRESAGVTILPIASPHEAGFAATVRY